jgi:hypothetical protein
MDNNIVPQIAEKVDLATVEVTTSTEMFKIPPLSKGKAKKVGPASRKNPPTSKRIPTLSIEIE